MPDQLVLRPDVVATVLPDGAVLLDLETKYFYELNATGWVVVQQFEAGATVDQVVRRCAAAGAGDRAGADVGRVVEVLRAERLVDTVDADGSLDAAPEVEVDAGGGVPWVTPTIEKQPEPLHRVMVSAFDPTLPLAE